MFNIDVFLNKFYKKIRSDEENKKQIIEILEKHMGIKFSPEEIEIKNYTLKIKASPTILNKIFICKENILQDISLNISGSKIIDVR